MEATSNPISLISINESTHELDVNHDALNILQNMSKPLVKFTLQL